MSESTKASVTVLRTLMHAGREYDEGETLELPEDVALDCAERGLVELAESPKPRGGRRRKPADADPSDQ